MLAVRELDGCSSYQVPRPQSVRRVRTRACDRSRAGPRFQVTFEPRENASASALVASDTDAHHAPIWFITPAQHIQSVARLRLLPVCGHVPDHIASPLYRLRHTRPKQSGCRGSKRLHSTTCNCGSMRLYRWKPPGPSRGSRCTPVKIPSTELQRLWSRCPSQDDAQLLIVRILDTELPVKASCVLSRWEGNGMSTVDFTYQGIGKLISAGRLRVPANQREVRLGRGTCRRALP